MRAKSVRADGRMVVELAVGEDEPTRLRDDGVDYVYPVVERVAVVKREKGRKG